MFSLSPLDRNHFDLGVNKQKRSFRRFLTRLQRKPPRGLDRLAANLDKQVWQETDCLSCGNCCKQMSPTYTNKDIRKISKHLGMTVAEFKFKWLVRDKDGDWINRSLPCQFFDLQTNKCGIYEIRPADCAGFPHLPKRKMVEYMHVHKQNLEMCPATFRLVEKLRRVVGNGEW
jgi:Fe-S-cluster containining protein